ncbi:MAG: hypothetical protein AAF399_14655 [Bacteroidota bacterium]
MSTQSGKIEKLINEGYEFKLGDYLNRGFKLFAQDAGPLIGFGVILALLALSPTILQFVNGSFGSPDPSDTLMYSLLFPGIVGLLQLPLIAGLYRYIHKLARNEERSFSDFFSGFGYWGSLLVMGFVMGLFLLLGTMLLVLPGIYLLIGYTLALPLLVLEDMDFWTAMETSRKIVTKNWWYFLLFYIIVAIVSSLGYLALIVGIAATMPIGYCIQYAAYEDIIQGASDTFEDKIEEIGRDDDDIFHGIGG